MEYFKIQLDQFSGSVILVSALLIGISLGWSFRGAKSQNNAIDSSTYHKVRSVNYKQLILLLSYPEFCTCEIHQGMEVQK